MSARRLRIGIDVGGTFTHAVAIDSASLELIGRAKVPTTHDAREGVARGVVESLLKLLAECRATPDEVALIAHSTTQATNALLEGDVARVGIIGIADGASARLARRQTAIPPVRLAPQRYLRTSHRFIRTRNLNDASIDAAIDGLLRDGAEVIVAAEAFSVDDPAGERMVCDAASRRGLPATATHQVSRLHGLRIRTRTAVINACMIPRMLATANMTEQAVRQAGIMAPLMIMRSDGGVMDIEEMRRRPVLTMLSGPAAGVAAALLYAHVSDGVFLEVGGTSTDISVIKNGRCQVRSAEIGGQKLHVSTLDVRTIGVAGGSMVYLKDGKPAQVGPRSAHIAGLPYLSFTGHDPSVFRAAEHILEGERYLVVEAGALRLAVTPTCASNLLGLVPPGDPASGRIDAIRAGFEALARSEPEGRASAARTPRAADARPQARVGHGSTPARAPGWELAETILDLAAARTAGVVDGLVRDYKLDRGVIRLVGGGGGASAIVPYLAEMMGLPHENAPNADVISAIGVALALVRDTVERTVISPNADDIRRIREEAVASVLRMGAAPDTVEVFVEVDAKRNLLRATAEGSTEIRRQELRSRTLSESERGELVARSIGLVIRQPGRERRAALQNPDREGGAPVQNPDREGGAPVQYPDRQGGASVADPDRAGRTPLAAPRIVARAEGFEVWAADVVKTRLFGLVREPRRAIRVLDAAGAIRWASNHADVRETTVAGAEHELVEFAERYTRYSDAGVTIPRCFVLLAGRIVDLAGLVEMAQVLEVLRIELKRSDPDAACVLLIDRA